MAIALWPSAGSAQVQRSGGGASAQIMQQYQQISAERNQLQTENEKLKKDLDDLKKQLDAANKQLGAAKENVSRGVAAATALVAARAQAESAEKSLSDFKTRTQELVARFRETALNLRDVETDRTKLQQDLATKSAAFDRCVEKNYSMFTLTGEILDRYEHQGAFSYIEKAEPFTRLKRTQIENLVDEYRERAEELRVKGANGSASAPVATPAAAPNTPEAPSG